MGHARPPSAFPATGAIPSRCPTTPEKSSCCFSIRAPTRPAAPGRPSISRGWRVPSLKAGPRYWVFQPIRQGRRKPFGTSTNFPYLSLRTRSTKCWRLTVPGGEKSMYGRTFQGILRTTVLIGPDGQITKIWRNVKVDGHADEVLCSGASLVHSLKINHVTVKSPCKFGRTELMSDRRRSADVVPLRSLFLGSPPPPA